MATSDPDSPACPLAVRLFGALEARVHGRSLPRLPTRKEEWLLALLALRAGSAVSRSQLAGTLWPDSRETTALRSLRTALWHLRRALGPQVARIVSPAPHTLALDLTGAWVDVLAFDAAIRAGSHAGLEEAVALYRGPLLEGCAEEWVFQERARREQAYLEARERLAAAAMAQGEPGEATRHLEAAVAVDPLRESAWRGLMGAQAAGGNYSAALEVYRELRERLYRELNTEPDTATRALYERLRAEAREKAGRGARGAGRGPGDSRSRAERRADAFTANGERRTAHGSGATHRLPVPPTPLIGREREVAQVCDLLRRPEVRLVTLTGAGGSGKTRLGFQVAADLQEEFSDDVFGVLLASVTDPDLVLSTIAQVLGVRETAGRPIGDALQEHLCRKQLLLLLDNFEQLLPAAPVITELLAGCPRLKVLVTSRARLRVRGEKEFPVKPLALPDPRHRLSVTDLSRISAVALFVERVRDVRPDFALTDENAPSSIEICRRLEGLPLAIELAAARMKLLPPEALLARLENRLGLLTGGARDAPARQQTLRNTIAWSYDLLTEAEQRLFRRLSVFVGGCTLEAVEAICDRARDLGIDVVEGMASLLDQSLLRPEEGTAGEPRYLLLETMREFGRERLVASGEETIVRQLHAHHFRSLAEEAGDHVRGAEQVSWLDRLEAEQGNLRAALEGSLPSSNDTALRLGATLWWFWMRRNHQHEGRDWLERILAGPGALACRKARVKVLIGAALFAENLGDHASALSRSEEALSSARTLGDRRLLAEVLGWRGVLLRREDPAASRRLHEESVSHCREIGDRWGLARSLNNLGDWMLVWDRKAEAVPIFTESLSVAREVGDRWRIYLPMLNLAEIARAQGDHRRAGDLYRECLAIVNELGDWTGIANCMTELARVAGAMGEWMRATRLLSAADAILQASGNPYTADDLRELDEDKAPARSALGETAFAVAWAEANVLPLEQAIDMALAG